MTNSSRFCSRCGKELTDAASMECGVGPICRKLDNALLAKTFPATPATVKAAWSKLNLLAFPEVTVHALTLVDTALAKLPETGETVVGEDWRETVKRIEWVLSHSVASDDRARLYEVVEGLGYVGLVSMWLGKAASGKATVTFEDGRLWLAGPRNTAGKDAIKAIAGRKFHPKTDTTPARWSVPASSAAAFATAVLKHWPNHEGLTEALNAALEVVCEKKLAYTTTTYPSAETTTTYPVEIIEEPASAPVKAAPKCALATTLDGAALKVMTPYNGGFVAALKKLPYKERAWNPVEKCWTVKVAHKATVVALVKEFYGEELAA